MEKLNFIGLLKEKISEFKSKIFFSEVLKNKLDKFKRKMPEYGRWAVILIVAVGGIYMMCVTFVYPWLTHTSLAKAKAGDFVFMGKERVGKNASYNDLDWVVLDVKDGKKLLLLRNLNGYVYPFHTSNCKSITWTECELRTYLNTEFRGNFTELEISQIVDTKNIELWEDGIDLVSIDKFFLLSEEELERYCGYIPPDKMIENAGGWWLRDIKNGNEVRYVKSVELKNISDFQYNFDRYYFGKRKFSRAYSSVERGIDYRVYGQVYCWYNQRPRRENYDDVSYSVLLAMYYKHNDGWVVEKRCLRPAMWVKCD